MESVTKDTEVSTKELAIVLGLSTRRVQQLIQDGVFDAKGRGRFILADAVQRYIALMSKPQMTEEEKKQEKLRLASETSLKNSKAVKAGLEVKELQGKLHRSEDVNNVMDDLIYTMRSMYLSLPGRLAVDTHNSASSAEAAEIIRKTVYADMKEISRYSYDPEKFAERVRERQKWEHDGDDDD